MKKNNRSTDLKKITVTVGIPAYNEEENIGNLIKSLLSQKQKSFKLKEIVVISDCSTDKTDEIVKSFKDKKIKLHRNKKRAGQAISQNKLKRYCKTEVVVLLNADILPKNEDFLENLVSPIIENKTVGIVCPRAEVLTAKNFFERVINISVEMKNNMFESWNDGNNLFTCKGTARAIRKDLLQKLVLPKLIAEDAYTYLYCIKSKSSYKYNPKAVIYYRSPNNFKDHQRQSLRFLNNKGELLNYFSQNTINKEFSLPKKILFKNLLTSSINHPIDMFSYFIISILVKIIPGPIPTAIWNPAKSTKSFKII